MEIRARIAVLFLTVTLFVPAAGAQDGAASSSAVTASELPDRPVPRLPAVNYTGPMPSRGFYVQDGETYPRFGFRQVADKNFWILAVALPGAASALDGVTTFRAISLGNSEGNPIFGRHPTPLRVAGIKLGALSLTSTTLYFLKREDMRNDYKGWKRDGFPPRWSRMALLPTAFWLALAANNLSLGRVSPTHPAQAAMFSSLRR